MSIETICAAAPVIPVLTIDDAATAGDLARALVDGGLPTLEITLRTPAALDAIRAMRDAAPDAFVGAGTVLNPDDMAAAKDAGATFIVSPGYTPALRDAADALGLPFLPGVATPSEAMAAAADGRRILKFFPAEANGGAATLMAWAAPLHHLRFCPTGGVTPQNRDAYLALPNVVCVGGSWIAPSAAVASQDWSRITARARDAAKRPAA